MKKPKYYITTAIAYTSRKPHIGNAYDPVLADAIARFKRKQGYQVYYLTGSDEHGQKIEELAKAAGVAPKAYVDRVADEIKGVWKSLNVSYDRFIRTTDADHEAAVQAIFKKLYDQGDIYKGEYEGKYCVPCESFFTPSQLKDGCCPDCGRPVTDAKEEAYFLRLSKYADRLVEYYEQNPGFFVPASRRAEMVNNFIKPGLADLCVSRSSFTWGIPVSFDPRHVTYVWIDALSNYITGIGYHPDRAPGPLFEEYWPADLHVIGKDIVRFHTIYWPVILMALGLPLPKRVLGHPWVLFGEDKMSKSRGNVVYADELAEIFGTDAVRYYLLSEIPFAQDGSITYEAVIAKFNSDLANTLGNLVSRTVAMAKKYFDGRVTRPVCAGEPVDQDLAACDRRAYESLLAHMESLHVGDAVNAVMDQAKRCNKYIDETMPWALAKDEGKKARLNDVLYHLLEAIRRLALELAPFMPETAEKIFAALGLENEDSFAGVEAPFGVPAAFEVVDASPLFARIDGEKLLKELTQAAEAKKKAAAKEEAKEEPKAPCSFEDFSKIELCCAHVLSCQKVEKSEKLLQFSLDVGESAPRTVLSGIAKFYEPQELMGKNLVLVKNLAPRKIMGVESHGMLLSSEAGGVLRVVTLAQEVPAGAAIH